ncbi:hypothetical protein EDB85DRAFT_624048 [Lactarius pseudohatsudake]|nr:hypothetical protein EDB85DRAFT_518230 [Lactarius pseudohatsudake]KAH9037188.1 hypothetical protein EDB85DRAFT_624048 [Lactarius pseudohatsudake]
MPNILCKPSQPTSHNACHGPWPCRRRRRCGCRWGRHRVVATVIVVVGVNRINPELAGERRRLVVCEACIAPKRPGQAKAVVGWPRLVARAAQSWQAVSGKCAVSPLLLATNMAWGFVGEVPSDAAAIITVMARGLSLAALFGSCLGILTEISLPRP